MTLLSVLPCLYLPLDQAPWTLHALPGTLHYFLTILLADAWCSNLGGHDTISLQHASLWLETIKVLMLVKKKLHLMHAQATAALQH
ncbi:hypothetical protein F5148DRAFT_497418 [Russula earlei]|uniref:Uncharacterized protein n=1 Tax=Russula earlei TaxID=71964 RepID=A0ACC0TXF9_9AGAM|nr:hypothetical protein F5148DRAFT_497418 [Russula earlei]